MSKTPTPDPTRGRNAVPGAAPDDSAKGAQRVKRQLTGGGMHDDTVSTTLVLFIALCFLVLGMGGGAPSLAMALLLAIASVIALVYLKFVPHIVPTAHGIAFVRDRRVGRDRIRVLSQGGVYQSATYLDERRFEPVFAYQRAFDAMFACENDMRQQSGHGIRRVLALGGGGYAWPKHALMHHEELQMDVVEIDPAITRAAERYFFLEELKALVGPRLRLICADGRELLNKLVRADEPTRFDAIVNDTFTGREPIRCLATVEALRAVQACLQPGGIYLANIVTRDGGTNLSFLRDEVATACEVFRYVWVLPATDEDLGGEDNYLLAASDADLALVGAIPFDEEFLGAPLHD